MRRTAIILSFVILSLGAVAQELNRTFYLLGTLTDYMGRYYSKNNPSHWGHILTLHQTRMKAIKEIEAVTEKTFKQWKADKGCRNCQEFYELRSYFLARRINSFYDFKKIKWMKDKWGFAVYTGSLKCEKIVNATKDEQISFLRGQILTAGEKIGENYKLSLYNSPDRYECLLKVLINLKCEIISKKKVEAIPVSYFIEFCPSEEIRRFIDN